MGSLYDQSNIKGRTYNPSLFPYDFDNVLAEDAKDAFLLVTVQFPRKA